MGYSSVGLRVSGVGKNSFGFRVLVRACSNVCCSGFLLGFMVSGFRCKKGLENVLPDLDFVFLGVGHDSTMAAFLPGRSSCKQVGIAVLAPWRLLQVTEHLDLKPQ